MENLPEDSSQKSGDCIAQEELDPCEDESSSYEEDSDEQDEKFVQPVQKPRWVTPPGSIRMNRAGHHGSSFSRPHEEFQPKPHPLQKKIKLTKKDILEMEKDLDELQKDLETKQSYITYDKKRLEKLEEDLKRREKDLERREMDIERRQIDLENRERELKNQRDEIF